MFKVKVILKVCPDDIFRMIYAVETKCSIAVHNHEHVKRLFRYLQC